MISVADLKRQVFALQWHEAVAVVAELADSMRANGLARVPVPESVGHHGGAANSSRIADARSQDYRPRISRVCSTDCYRRHHARQR